MIFNALIEAAERGELILVNGGLCHFHLRKDGQLTIREIIVLPERQRQGVGTAILEQLKQTDAVSIFAKCPYDLPANEWYYKRGFVDEGIEVTKSDRRLRLWRYHI